MEFGGFTVPNRRGVALEVNPIQVELHSPLNPTHATSIVFIAAGVSDADQLVAGIQPGAEVHVLSAENAVAQITQTLAGRKGISSLQIVSHGSAGRLLLGHESLSLGNVASYTAQFKTWQQALTADADILLYGCDLAADTSGQSLMQSLSQLTGADVAASIDITGNQQLGGNWVLEARTGEIESAIAFTTSALSHYQGLLNIAVSGDLGKNSISADGKFIVFSSTEPLTGSDTNKVLDTTGQPSPTEDGSDVFLFDVANNSIRLVSSRIDAPNTSPQGMSKNAIISKDGSTIVFTSSAPGLTQPNNPIASNVVRLYRWKSGVIEKITDNVGGEFSVSNDGTAIAFMSTAKLTTEDTNTVADVYLWSTSAGNSDVQLVSKRLLNVGTRNSQVFRSMISGDGNVVAFSSLSDNFTASDFNNSPDVLRWNRTNGEIINISELAASGANSVEFDLNTTGDRIVFVSASDDFGPQDNNSADDVYLWNNGTIELISATSTSVSGNPAASGRKGAFKPAISGDGKFVAFVSNAKDLTSDDTKDKHQIFLRDIDQKTTALVSKSTAGAIADNPGTSNQLNDNPTISKDGSKVAYTSLATNLTVNPDNNSAQDIFVYDAATASKTILVSRTSTETVGNQASGLTGGGGSAAPNLSANGTHVAFLSNATNLVTGATYDSNNTLPSIFVNDLATGVTQLTSAKEGLTVSLSVFDGEINENGVPFDSYKLVRTKSDSDITIKLSIAGTASAADYTFEPLDPTKGSVTRTGTDLTVTMRSGVSELILKIKVTDDVQAEAVETINLTLLPNDADPNGKYAIATPAAQVVNIKDVDFVVTSTADTGEGSLRQAILNANSVAGTGVIEFQIPGAGPHTIALLSALPDIEAAITIDATGKNIELDGTAATNANGLVIKSDDVVVKGLTIKKFAKSGILIDADKVNIQDNIIKENQGDGVSSTATTTGSKLSQNLIFSNGKLGIDLGGDGPGANPPIKIDRAELSGTDKTLITATYTGAPNTDVTIEFFKSSTADTSGFGEGQIFLGVPTGPVRTDASGKVTVAYLFNGTIPLGEFVTATATTDSTSEFSNAIAVIDPASLIPRIILVDKTTNNTEGNTGTKPFIYEVELTRTTDKVVTVKYETVDGSATVADEDYEAVAPTLLTFNPGDLKKTITVNVKGDAKRETPELFTVKLTEATNATLGTGTSLTLESTIANDDDKPALNIASKTLKEGDSGTSPMVFTVTLSSASDEEVTVDYTIAEGEAKATEDYIGTAGKLTFAKGETSKDITINIVGDTKKELDETFSIVLQNPSSTAVLGTATAIGKITDDDQRPIVSIDGVSASENQGPFVFVVKLSNSNDQPITVKYATLDGTTDAAIAGKDYTAASGTLTFNANETQKSITIAVQNDLLFEPEEQFFVQLSEPTNADLSATAQRVTGSIGNDDSKPTVSIVSVNPSLPEGNGPADTPVVFEVTLSSPSEKAISVNYTTSDGIAKAPGDYKSNSDTLTFNAGETKKTITVLAIGDTDVEQPEDFSVELSNVIGDATLSTVQSKANVFLTNDDSPVVPLVSIEGDSKQEGAEGSTTRYEFKVRLSQVTTVDVSVDYETRDASAKVSSNDYVSTSGTLLFKPGETLKTITVNVRGDSLFEDEENFDVVLKNLSVTAQFLTQRDEAKGVIGNDDAKPVVSITGSKSIAEGAQGETKELVFNVSLPNGSEAPVTVLYTTEDGSIGSNSPARVSDSDYQATSGTLTFAPGQLQQAITVRVVGDNKYESEETFTLKLTSATGADLSTNARQGVATILPDDFRPQISANGDVKPEGTAILVPVKLSNPSSETVSVKFTTKNGEALDSDSDYVAQNGTLTFLPGEIEKTITIQTVGDTRYELDEKFTVEFSDPVNASIATIRAIATLQNDDPLPQLRVSLADSKPEGNTGITPFVFVVSLSQASPEEITVNYSAADGTATLANNDFTPTTGALRFLAGETQKTITVNVLGDTQFEQSETFQLTLSNPSKATISTQNSVATIQNDDRNPNAAGVSEDAAFDVVLRNDATGQNRFWYFNKTINGGMTNLLTVTDPPRWEIEAVADFDGDSNADILWRSYQIGMVAIWKMDRDQIAQQFIVQTVPDRKLDIVWRNSRTGENSIWIMNDFQYVKSMDQVTVPDLSWDIAGVGDVDGDGISDLVWRNNRTGENHIWQIKNGQLANHFPLLPVPDVTWSIEAVGDFNNDRTADVLWRNQLSGQNTLWLLANSTLGTAKSLPVVDQSWEIEKIGDFNLDSQTDILWRNIRTGELSLWWMFASDYGTFVSAGKLPDLNWTIEDVGDFTGDRTPDILIRNYATGANAVLKVNSSLLRGSADLPNLLDSQWRLVGTEDFDRDGQGDLLWRNLQSGQNQIWLMNGTQIRQTETLVQVPDQGWTVHGTGDFNGDGFSDILWRNVRTGENSVWFMSAGQLLRYEMLPQVVDLNWRVEGIADFNGDGFADVIWRNYRTGENSIWVMQPGGQSVAQYLMLTMVQDPNWRIRGIGDFNNDGKFDFFWVNSQTNETTTWLMNYTTLQAYYALLTPRLGWDVVGVGDFNGDGTSDVLWRTANENKTSIWYLRDGQFGVSSFLPGLDSLDWRIRGVEDFKSDSAA
jgi:hypothetical protein